MVNLSLQGPRFKYLLVLINQYQNYKKEDVTKVETVVCHADSYKVEDGNITFLQTLSSVSTDDKKTSIQVASYPKGKWEACFLLDKEDKLPIFNYSNKSALFNRNLQQSEDYKPEADSAAGSVPFRPPYHQINKPAHIPGVNLGNNNLNDYKKQKQETIIQVLQEFFTNQSLFSIEPFLLMLNKNRTPKFSEEDVSWAVVAVIKAKTMTPNRFINVKMQRILDRELPPIVKRHWDNKMNPILEILQDRSETKDVSPIDLVVWLAINKVLV